jgi:hypothetical protein
MARAVSGPSPISANRQSGWTFGTGRFTEGVATSVSVPAGRVGIELVRKGVVVMAVVLSTGFTAHHTNIGLYFWQYPTSSPIAWCTRSKWQPASRAHPQVQRDHARHEQMS